MRQAPTSMVTFVLALFCTAVFGVSLSAADMDKKKTAPALKTAAGSKAEMHNSEGIEHYNQEHWDVAKKHFMEAVKSDASSAVAHYNLALALDKSGDHKTAIEHFHKAKELGKDNPEIQQSEILQAHLKKH
ncbi:MAG TPA: tetratricopeptide repeat protein [Nitrospiraceae bacterium]|nr:tetratricopeptide repeat protein [Nitrospiraceae bacterium]